jgi:transcription-repair coupling factor (superfamily II helicase)
MLEDAVTALKAGIEEPVEEAWSPTIALGAPVTIPEDYVEDLTVRLGLYRRLSTLENDAEMESFGAELLDIGVAAQDLDGHDLQELFHLRRQRAEAVDQLGTEALHLVVVHFRDKSFANPQGLAAMVVEQGSFAKVRPDMSVVFIRLVAEVDHHALRPGLDLLDIGVAAQDLDGHDLQEPPRCGPI